MWQPRRAGRWRFTWSEFGDCCCASVFCPLLAFLDRSLISSRHRNMERTRRPLYKFLTLCWLLPGAFVQSPVEEGQNSSASASSFSSSTVIPSVVGLTNDSTDASTLNISIPNSSESLASTARGFVDTTKIQDVDQTISRSGDVSSFSASVTNLVKAQPDQDYAKPTSITSWTTSGRNLTGTEHSQSEKTQGPTATPQPISTTVVMLGVTESKLVTTQVTDHEVITKQSGAESTSAPVMTDMDETVLTVPASTSVAFTHRSSSVETEHLTIHMQKKTSVTDPPSILATSSVGEDPLVIAVIFIFIMTVGILALMCFLRYRQRSGQLQFRRLQDLPMDDMMEDTPLSLYSY